MTRDVSTDAAGGQARVDCQFAEQRPLRPGHDRVDDSRGLGEVRREVLFRVAEVCGHYVRGASILVGERFDKDVLVGVLDAARPLEPEASGFRSRRVRERTHDLWPGVGVCWPDAELGGDEDQPATPGSTLPCATSTSASATVRSDLNSRPMRPANLTDAIPRTQPQSKVTVMLNHTHA